MKKDFLKICLMGLAAALILLSFAACGNDRETKLLYQGRSSLRLTAKDGTTVYVDPFGGSGYDLPADIILVTHDHPDHNQIDLVTQKNGCFIITHREALKGGTHNSFTIKDIEIKAVEAYNDFHNIAEAVGYIITIDGIKIYAAGDTSTTEQMSSLSRENIDYALLPCDGIFNMDGEEAGRAARIIGARHNIPYHTHPEFPDGLFDRSAAEQFAAPNRLILEPGEEIILTR